MFTSRNQTPPRQRRHTRLGKSKVKSELLAKFYEILKCQERKLDRFKIAHVNKEYNSETNSLAGEVAHTSKAKGLLFL